MALERVSRSRSSHSILASRVFALLIVICLVECASEQKIISRGKPSNLVETTNGWRSQRGGMKKMHALTALDGDSRNGVYTPKSPTSPSQPAAPGSCLSYGHSCWGAHGKRSGKAPATAPDWYLTRLLRRMAANTEMNNANQAPSRNDLSAIFQRLSGDDSPSTNQLADNDDVPVELPFKTMEAKPMLDDDMISKIKLWQVMRDSSEDK